MYLQKIDRSRFLNFAFMKMYNNVSRFCSRLGEKMTSSKPALGPPGGKTQAVSSGEAVDVVPRSMAIDIPGSAQRRRQPVVYYCSPCLHDRDAPASLESIGIGQELRRIGDELDRHFGSSGGGSSRASSLKQGRSRSFSFVSLP